MSYWTSSLSNAVGQGTPIVPKGKKAPNVTQYVVNIWRTQLNTADSIFTYGLATGTYDQGARLNWHSTLPESGVTYIAVTSTQKGGTIWLEKVAEEYSHKN